MFSYNSPRGWCPACRGFGELFYLPDVERGARAEAIEESWFGWQEGKRQLCGACQGTRLNPRARAVRLENVGGREPPPPGPAGVADHCGHFQRHGGDRAGLVRRSCFWRARGGNRARHRAGNCRAAAISAAKWGWGICNWAAARPPFRAAKPSASGWPPSLAPISAASFTFWTSRPSACTPPTTRSCWPRWPCSRRAAIRCSWSSTTRRPCAGPIILLTSARAREPTGAAVVACGPLPELMKHKDSVTARCLRARKSFPAGGRRRPVDARTPRLRLRGAKANNLRNLSVAFPLRRFVCLTGVSGSGKSTLLRECLLPALRRELRTREPAGGQVRARPGRLGGGGGAGRL